MTLWLMTAVGFIVGVVAGPPGAGGPDSPRPGVGQGWDRLSGQEDGPGAPLHHDVSG